MFLFIYALFGSRGAWGSPIVSSGTAANSLLLLLARRLFLHRGRGRTMVETNAAASELCEKDAIEKIKRGETAGMVRLYDLYRPRIYSFCLRNTGNAFDADDLTQEVFIQVFRKVSTFRGDAEFKSWLYTVALNFVRLHARKQRRQGRVFEGNVAERRLNSVASRTCNPTQRVALTQALSNLTPVRRMTLVLHDIQGLTHNEVAARLGVTVIASKSRLHRAHMALRRALRGSPATVGHS
jgi:RNA polymerase sigma-70 factor (ECF subfamily)